MSDTLESPEEPSEMIESEPIEQPEILKSVTINQEEIFKPEPLEDAENYDLETVELPENFTTVYSKNVDKFGPDPMDIICSECGVTTTTRTSQEITKFGNLDSTSCLYVCLNFCLGGIVSNRNKLNFIIPLFFCDWNKGTTEYCFYYHLVIHRNL